MIKLLLSLESDFVDKEVAVQLEGGMTLDTFRSNVKGFWRQEMSRSNLFSLMAGAALPIRFVLLRRKISGWSFPPD